LRFHACQAESTSASAGWENAERDKRERKKSEIKIRRKFIQSFLPDLLTSVKCSCFNQVKKQLIGKLDKEWFLHYLLDARGAKRVSEVSFFEGIRRQ
jgi:hypothetical protein